MNTSTCLDVPVNSIPGWPASPPRNRLAAVIGRAFIVLAVLLGLGIGLPSPAAAQTTCTPMTTRDWMVVSDPLAQDIRPRDCATVEQTPPDFRWPDVSSTARYSVTLTYPDGHTRTLSAAQNWRNWDEVLTPGTYSWTVSYVGGGASQPRKFIVPSGAKTFLVPSMTTVLSSLSAKSHPRSLPTATMLATMKTQRSAAVNALLTEVSGDLTQTLPANGASADDAYSYSRLAQASMMACVYSAQDNYCRDAVRRVVNLAAWDPAGTTAYSKMDAAARYLTWTVATGYDWLYPRLSSTQRTQILASLRVRTGEMYNDVVGTRSRVAKTPRDSQGNRTLATVAIISTLLAGDLTEATPWLQGALPLALNAIDPWGGEEGGFANGASPGLTYLGAMLPLWVQLRHATGIDVAQKPWVRNWGRYFTYFTPPGMTGNTSVFGDSFELNDKERQARFGKALVYFSPTPLGRWHAGRLSGELSTRIEYLMAPPADFTEPQLFPAGTPNALALPSIGQVAMHSNLSDLARTSIYFKSSPPPYGAFNQSHADQNSFVINSGGQRLAIESGYYDSYGSAHWKNWYHTTKAKNAITFDGGQGQLFYEQNTRMGYGNLTRFSTTSGYDVVTGDATPAYGGALTKAQRTMVYLRPNLVVVYDNLASATSRQWEWNIHALNQMTTAADNKITIQNGTQKLCVTVLAGPTVRFSQSNAFSSNPTGTFAQQWHGKFASTTRLPATEFVTLLNVGCTTTTASASKANGIWTVPVGDKVVTIGATGGVAVSTAAAATPTPTPTSPTPTSPTPTTTEPTTVPRTTPILPSTNMRAVSTFESIGVYWKPTANPGSAGCPIRYQKIGDAAWKQGLPLWYDARNNECRGSIVQVSPGSTYSVQVGMPGQNPVAEVTISTWKTNFPIARTVTVPNSSTTLNITSGGSATGYVLYTVPAGGQSTIDVANNQAYNITISAPFVIVRGLTLKGARQDAIRLLQGAHDVVIEDNDISGWGRLKGNSVEGLLGVNYDSAVRAMCTDRTMQRIIIQRNTIHDPRYTANSWSVAHPEGPQGISMESCGGNHVIRHNEIYGGSSGNYYNDAIGGCCNFTNLGFPNSDTDIYGNIIKNTWDDAIEAEGANTNVRIWGNYIDQTAIGIATTVIATGPTYIFRNVYNRSRQYKALSLDTGGRNHFAKSGSQSATIGGGRRYIFHNTLLQATQSGLTYPLGAGGGIGAAGLTITNTISRNNIFHVWKSNYPVYAGPSSGSDFGYDLYNGTLGSSTATNSIRATPIYQAGNGWVSESGGMYQQAPSSPGYDKGVRIPNFNDNFAGAAPDIGASEAGATSMQFGLKAGAAFKP